MKKKWVVIRLETKAREFQSKTLLAYHLINKGYGVILTYDRGRKAHLFPRGAYLLNNTFESNNHLFRRIKANGNEIIVLDEEGLVYVDKTQYLKRISENNLNLASKFLCYGSEQYKVIAEAFPAFENKLVITGNPRINLLGRMFDLLDSDRVAEITKKHAPFFLLVSNFSHVNLFGTERDFEDRYQTILQYYNELGFLNTEEELKTFEEAFRYANSIFESFLSMLPTLAKEFPEVKIIVRPHPSEDKKMWEEVAAMHPNVEVIYEGGLTEWIKASELVIQNSCTSAIESLFLDKSCISYRPFKSDDFDQPLPNKLSVNVSTIEELLEFAEKARNDESTIITEYDAYRSMATEYISFFDGDRSIHKILEIFENEAIEPTHYSHAVFRIRYYSPWNLLPRSVVVAKRGLGKLVHFVLDRLEMKNNRLFSYLNERVEGLDYSIRYKNNKFQVLSVEEITEIMEKYDVIYSLSTRLRVKQIDSESFIIEKVPTNSDVQSDS